MQRDIRGADDQSHAVMPRMSLKCAYYLTDCSAPGRGNTWIVPGSIEVLPRHSAHSHTVRWPYLGIVHSPIRCTSAAILPAAGQHRGPRRPPPRRAAEGPVASSLQR
jgi:hypothetical protein